MKKKSNVLISFIFSLLSSYFIVMHQKKDIGTILDQVFAFLYITLLLLIVYLGIRKYISNNINRISIKKRKIIKIIAIIFSVLVIFLVDADFLYKPGICNINVIATGEKNTLSKNSEVWIMSIKLDEKYIDLSKIDLDGFWEYKNGHIVSYKNQPNILKIKESALQSIEIQFFNHQWSGKCKIISDMKTDELDLYSNVERVSSYNIPVKRMHLAIYSIVAIYLGIFALSYNLILFMNLYLTLYYKNSEK